MKRGTKHFILTIFIFGIFSGFFAFADNLSDDLIDAAEKGKLEVLQSLLAKGAGVDVKDNLGRTPIIYAAANGYTDIVQAILAKGADVDVKANDGTTALFMAESKGYKDIARLLRQAGAK